MKWRYPFVFIFLVLLFVFIITRLFYWQIVEAEMLSGLAQSQYSGLIKIEPKRGEIKTSDGFPIVANKVSYLLYLNPTEIKNKIAVIIKRYFLNVERYVSIFFTYSLVLGSGAIRSAFSHKSTNSATSSRVKKSSFFGYLLIVYYHLNL